MEIEEEQTNRPNYSHYQKFLGQNIRMLPKKLQDSAENSKNKLLEALNILNKKIQNSEKFKNLENMTSDTKEEYRDIFKTIIQSLYISYNLQSNFKVDLAHPDIENSLISGFKALSTFNFDLNFGNRLTKILDKFQYFFMPLEKLTEFAHKEKIWEKFYEFIKNNFQNNGTVSLVGKLKLNPIKTAALLKICAKIFKLDFAEIYQKMKIDKINFFELNTGGPTDTGINMFSFIDLGALEPEDLYVVMKDFHFSTKIIKRDAKLVIKVRYLL